MLLNAVYTPGDGRVHLTFSQDLVDGPYDASNFLAWDSFGERIVTAALRISPNVVRLVTSAGAFVGGPARTSYLATPPELVGLTSGLAVAAYNDFPMT